MQLSQTCVRKFGVNSMVVKSDMIKKKFVGLFLFSLVTVCCRVFILSNVIR